MATYMDLADKMLAAMHQETERTGAEARPVGNIIRPVVLRRGVMKIEARSAALRYDNMIKLTEEGSPPC